MSRTTVVVTPWITFVLPVTVTRSVSRSPSSAPFETKVVPTGSGKYRLSIVATKCAGAAAGPPPRRRAPRARCRRRASRGRRGALRRNRSRVRRAIRRARDDPEGRALGSRVSALPAEPPGDGVGARRRVPLRRPRRPVPHHAPAARARRPVPRGGGGRGPRDRLGPGAHERARPARGRPARPGLGPIDRPRRRGG